MTTRTDIANRALASIGAKATIANFDKDPTTEAQNVRLIYDSTRDAMLRGAHWNFARAMAYIDLLKSAPGTNENPAPATAWNPATMPAPPWLFEYSYPSDAVQIRFVAPTPYGTGGLSQPMFSVPLVGANSPLASYNAARFLVATDLIDGKRRSVILSNMPTALACYTARIDDEGLWDASFQEAMVAALAARLAVPLTANRTVAQSSAAQANGFLAQARVRDGNEGMTIYDSVPDWLTIRGVPGYGANTGAYIGPWTQPFFLGG